MSDQLARRALYLRWRPQTFSEVVGQEHVTRTLRNAIRSGRLAHAYLLCGPRGTGKTSLARILYRAANCANPVDGEPCCECAQCTSAAAGRALDLIEVDAASNRGIDDIRQLRERVAYSPAEARYRVYIIDEAHELTQPAWDAFLKTLEEPPPRTIFVLATTEAHKVPPTIVSRCQRFDLRRISLADVRVHLARVAEQESMQVEPAALDSLARMARGGLRDALSLLDQLHAYAGDRLDIADVRSMLGLVSLEVVRDFVQSLESEEPGTAIERLASIVEQGADLRQFASEVIAHLRGLLLTRSGAGGVLGGDYSTDDLAWFKGHADRWSKERLLHVTAAFAEGLARFRDPTQLALHLELVVLECCTANWEEAAAQPASAASETSTRPPGGVDTVPSDRPQSEAATRPILDYSSGEPDSNASHLAGSVHEATTQQVSARKIEASAEIGGEHVAVDEEPVLGSGSAAEPIPQRAAGTDHAPESGVFPPASQPSMASSAGLSLELMRQRWPTVMDRLRVRNHMVAALLEAVELQDVHRGELRLAFAYAFHQKEVNDLRNRRLVEDVLSETLGATVRVSCILRPINAKPLSEQEATAELESLIAEDPVIRRAVDLWGRNLTIVE